MVSRIHSITETSFNEPEEEQANSCSSATSPSIQKQLNNLIEPRPDVIESIDLKGVAQLYEVLDIHTVKTQ